MEYSNKCFIKTVSILLFLLSNLCLTQTSYGNITPLIERTLQVQNAIVATIGSSSVSDVTEAQIAAITTLNLRSKGITELKSGDFSGMSSLTSLNLYDNELSSLPDDVFKGLTALTSLRLSGNTVDPMPITISLEKVAESQFRAVVPSGAPFEITLSVNVNNGSIVGDTTTLTISKGEKTSDTHTVARTLDMQAAVLVGIDTIPNLPVNHFGYVLSKSETLPVEVIKGNTAPVFTDGTSTTREITENEAAGVNIGSPVDATDIDGVPLTYTLSGIDAADFEIDTQTGQLKTKEVLDYETKSFYSVTINVSDGLLTDIITVSINIIDIVENFAPTFTEGIITVRKIPENTESNVNIGMPVVATDKNGIAEPLTYSLNGIDAESFDIETETGQLKTKAALDFEKKPLHVVKVTVSDGELTDTITVVVNLIDLADTELVSIILPLGERTPTVRDKILESVIAEDMLNTKPSIVDITAAQVAVISELNLRDASITQLKSGDFSGMSGLLNLNLHNNRLDNLPIGIFEGLTALTTLRLGGNLLNPMPLFVSLQQVDKNQFQVFVPSGAPFDIVVPINVTNGYMSEGITTATVRKGTLLSDTFTIIPTDGMSSTPSVDIGNLPPLPLHHYGYILAKSTACNRSPEVVTAVEKMYPLLMHCQNVEDVDLATITFLNLDSMGIKSLRNRDFSGMLSLTNLFLHNNELTELPEGIFRGLPSLSSVSLQGNRLTELPEGIFEGLVSLETLDLSNNKIDPLPLTIFLQVAGVNQFKAVIPAAAPFDIVLPLTISNGNLTDNLDTITIPKGSVESELYTIVRTPNTLNAVTAEIKTLPSLPALHAGYKLVELDELPLVVIERINVAPAFSEGSITTRSIPENTLAGINIGDAVVATDANDDMLIYNLGGDDAEHFEIDTNAGQLRTKTTLDYEMKSSYSVLVSVSDGILSKTIDVTILITNVAEKPIFAEGSSTNRTVAENTVAASNIGDVIAATDPDKDTLSYMLSGTDAAAFDIDSSTGQLKTKSPLDYETKSSYSVLVSVTDGSLSDNIDVVINIIDIAEKPVFAEGANAIRVVSENAITGTNIGEPISATDEDKDKLTYTLSGTDAETFDIDAQTGQLKTKLPLDYETKTSYSVLVSVSDGSLSDHIDVVINIIDITDRPVFIEGANATRIVTENTDPGSNIGTPISATYGGKEPLTYNLSGTDASVFDIDPSTGQLKTKLPLDYETKSSYSVNVSASDGRDSVNINIVINIANIPEKPVFIIGANSNRSVGENAPPGTDIGVPIRATDEDKDLLVYSLRETDAEVFDIDSSTGQLKTKIPLDYETKSSYSVNVSVFDGIHSVDINVVINIINEQENRAPVFSEGGSTTRSINENVPIGTNLEPPVSATDLDGDSLSYALVGSHASRFNIDATNGQIQTKLPIDYEELPTFYMSVIVTDGIDSVWISITVEVIDLNDPPIFEVDSLVFTLPENVQIGQQFGRSVAVSEQDGERIDYTLGGTDSSSFSFSGIPAILHTRTTFDFDTKSVFSVTITASDQTGGTDTLPITINIFAVDAGVSNHAPIFTEGTTTTRSVAENTVVGTSIGAPIEALDVDQDPLTYSLSGTDATSFSIVSTSGQLQTNAALDFETRESYSVIVDVTDGSLTAQIAVTIGITDANDPPVFADDSVTFSVPENTPLNTVIGTVTATDQDGGSLRYQTSGPDSRAFSTDLNSGRVFLNILSLDYETKSSYSITITALDRHNASDSIDVTINITQGEEGSGAPELIIPDVQLVNPITTALLPNYPNPLNPETWLPYQLSKPSDVTITIYNMRGVVVRKLILGYQPAGYYKSRTRAAYWDGRNSIGEKVATGVYFYTFTAGDFTAIRKMLIRK